MAAEVKQLTKDWMCQGIEAARKKKWRRNVEYAIDRLMAALHPDDVVLGGSNTRLIKTLPRGWRTGSNADAFSGGFRLWDESGPTSNRPLQRPRQSSTK